MVASHSVSTVNTSPVCVQTHTVAVIMSFPFGHELIPSVCPPSAVVATSAPIRCWIVFKAPTLYSLGRW